MKLDTRCRSLRNGSRCPSRLPINICRHRGRRGQCLSQVALSSSIWFPSYLPVSACAPTPMRRPAGAVARPPEIARAEVAARQHSSCGVAPRRCGCGAPRVAPEGRLAADMAVRLRVIAVLAAVLGAAVRASCPNTNWLLVGSKCYLPLPVPPFAEVMEQDAREMCQHIHPTSDLPEIYNSNDLLLIQELSQGLGTWLGLVWYPQYQAWRWRSYPSNSVTYTHWKEGQPNNTYPCAFMQKDGFWESASCNTTTVKHHVICYVNY